LPGFQSHSTKLLIMYPKNIAAVKTIIEFFILVVPGICGQRLASACLAFLAIDSVLGQLFY
jgi:hypothetical protein